MHPTLAKLSLRPGATALVLNAPEQLQWLLPELRANGPLLDLAAPGTADLALVFVTRSEEIEAWAPVLAVRAPGDALVWFAYPKRRSKNYQSQVDRTTGWAPLDALGFRGVRLVALDADWTAYWFRHADHAPRRRRRAGSPPPHRDVHQRVA